MPADKNYAEMPLEELLAEEKKAKSQRVVNAVLGGLMFGLAIYAATHHKGFILTVILLIIPFQMGRKNAQNLKDIQAEMSRRGAATEE